MGQVTDLELAAFLCDHKSLDEIRQHSIVRDSAFGDLNGCWISKGLKTNDDILYSVKALDLIYLEDGASIFKCVLFSIMGVWLSGCFVILTYALYRDLKRFKGNYYDRQFKKRDLNNKNKDIDKEKKQCCCGCWIKLNQRIYDFQAVFWFHYMRLLGPDKPLWAMLKFFTEIFEIALQTVVLFSN